MKVLALVNAHNLAHVSRPLEIAKVLRRRGHQVVFAGLGKYLPIASADGFETRELPYITKEQLIAAFHSQEMLRALYAGDRIQVFVEAEQQLYRHETPDLVIVDNRVTACTSAELAGIPSVGVLNVHMTLYRELPFWGSARVRALLPRSLSRALDRGLNSFEFMLWNRLMMGPLQQLRRKHGLPCCYSYQLEHGDMTLLADIPEFNPVRCLPPTAHYVGPLTWRNDSAEPCKFSPLGPGQRRVYLSLGSESLNGDGVGLAALGQNKNIHWVVATGGTEFDAARLPENVLVQRFVNAEDVLPHCDAVVCHGGNGTLYQALSYGLPIVGLATHAEQTYGLKRVAELRLGHHLQASDLQQDGAGRLLRAVSQVLADPRYRRNARRFRQMIAGWNPPKRAADLLERFAQRRSAAVHAPHTTPTQSADRVAATGSVNTIAQVLPMRSRAAHGGEVDPHFQTRG